MNTIRAHTHAQPRGQDHMTLRIRRCLLLSAFLFLAVFVTHPGWVAAQQCAVYTQTAKADFPKLNCDYPTLSPANCACKEVGCLAEKDALVGCALGPET